MAKESAPKCPELVFLNRDLDFTQPGGSQIALLLRHFWFEGPNGSHLCIVLLVLGPNVSAIWDKLPNPSKVSRSIALQVGNGLQFLYWNGIVHGNFRPSNILLRLSGFDALSEEQLFKELGEPQMEELLTTSGEPLSPSAPKYIVRPWNLMKLDSRHSTDDACIIDFGGRMIYLVRVKVSVFHQPTTLRTSYSKTQITLGVIYRNLNAPYLKSASSGNFLVV